MANPLDPTAQLRRVRYLERLAEMDGRNDPSHPYHGRFTGLYQARIAQLVEHDKTTLLGGSDD